MLSSPRTSRDHSVAVSTLLHMGLTAHSWARAAAATAVFALALAGCSSGGTTGGPPSPTAGSPTGGKLDAVLRPTVTAALTTMRVPGATVYVAVPGQDPWQAAIGVADLATDEPMQVGDHMRIGSITKTFTATVVLQLAQEAKLDLDARATKYIPGAPTNGATVRQLLAMTSGVNNYTDDPGFLGQMTNDPTKLWTSEELLNFARRHKPYFAPGKGYHYTNTNYIMLGMIAEKVGGKPVGDLINERILKPLAMGGCSYPAETAIPDPYSHGYQFGTWPRRRPPRHLCRQTRGPMTSQPSVRPWVGRPGQ